MADTQIVAADAIPAGRLREHLVRMWHSETVVAHGEQIDPAALPGFVAVDDTRIAGHASYRIVGDACELTSIAADPPHRGVGSDLLVHVVEAARAAGCRRVWLTTTNDNVDALRFYQRRGFRVSALRRGAVDRARVELKPEIPVVGAYRIPMSDELDLELLF